MTRSDSGSGAGPFEGSASVVRGDDSPVPGSELSPDRSAAQARTDPDDDTAARAPDAPAGEPVEESGKRITRLRPPRPARAGLAALQRARELARRLFPLVLLLSAAPLPAQQQKLDPAIRELIEPATLIRVRALPRLGALVVAEEQPMGGTLALERRTAAEEPLLGVFVRVRSAAALAELRAAGAEIGAVVDDLVSARVPLGALERIAASPNVRTVEAARALRIENDSGMKAIHADELRSLVGDTWTGAAGQGVIVGIYDTGLDLRHEDFIDPLGRTRVLGLWDQNLTGTPPQGFSRGHYCSRVDIQLTVTSGGASGCPQKDFNGHGTHVAGTAAGDGSAGGSGPSQYRYTGVAPAADLLIVNGGPGVFFENLIIDGLTWLRQEGQRLGRPVVANLSLGGQFGPHDGTRLYERIMDALSGPGFIIVISAGNNGVNGNTTPPVTGRLIHARGTATGTQTVEFEFEIPAYSPNTDPCNGNYVNIALWYEAADQLRIEVVRPAGSVAAATRGQVVTGDDAEGRVRIDNGSGGPNEENGDIEAAISLSGCGTSGVPRAGNWKVRVTPTQAGSGSPFDMWITSNAGPVPTGRQGFDNRFVVASPGNARRAITVGAFVSRLCWPSVSTAAQICYTQREELGDLARFSAAGPTRDGRLKPEIVAPGLGVMSALSRDATATPQRTAPDNVHSTREGTSMSAPHVTGAVAILLQGNPNLTPEDVKGAIAGTANRDAFTSRVYDPVPGGQPQDWWGNGKLNVRDALLALADGSPAILGLESESATPAGETLGTKGSRLPLLRMDLIARGFEAIRVDEIGFDVSGRDPDARLLLIADRTGNGMDVSDPVLGAAAARLDGSTLRVLVRPDSLTIYPFTEKPVFVALELSGKAPNGTLFEAKLLPSTIRTVGVRSGARDRLDPIIAATTSGTAETTVLQPEQLLSLSENPVRGNGVTFNFAETPAMAAVYTMTGRRVVDLCRRAAISCGTGGTIGTSMQWDLSNDDGRSIAPGMYLVIFRVSGQVFRQKLMILRSGK